MKKFQITRTADMATLQVFREFVKKAVQKHLAIDSQTLYDLQLAVDEVCTSIITLGYAGVNPGSIIISLELFDDKVIISLTDFGRAFEPVAQTALEKGDENNLGLPFIYRMMDEVEYTPASDGNVMKITKNLKLIVLQKKAQ